MTAQEKWQIFLEASAEEALVGEILRRYGAYSSEPTKIRRQAEEGALRELGKRRYAKKPESVPYAEHEKVKAELAAKGKALAQMSEEYLVLKKVSVRLKRAVARKKIGRDMQEELIVVIGRREKVGFLEALQEEVFETTPQTFCVKIAD